jgi:hypothetical protein
VLFAAFLFWSEGGAASGGGARPVRPQGVRWHGTERPAGDITEFTGRLDLRSSPGSVVASFTATGNWSIEFNGSVAFLGEASAGERRSIDRAPQLLHPGENSVRATFQGAGVCGPPAIELKEL